MRVPSCHSSSEKNTILSFAHEHLYPDRVERFLEGGIDFVPDKRQGYCYWDMDGRQVLDLHINGGTFNLGHRNPQLIAVLEESLKHWDIGNHHFASAPKVELARALIEMTPGDMKYVVFTPSGSEANDVAIKSARFATGRRKVVALDAGYHGRTGLSGAAGDDESARYFHSDYPGEFVKVPFNDLNAMQQALTNGDVALVLIEPIPATYGFPIPDQGYLQGVKKLCEQYGTLFAADEVQTGLGRTGHRWAVEAWDVEPDMLIIGKGLSGGLYPMAAVVLTAKVGAWLESNGWGHVSTFGGSDLGCCVALEALKISLSEETLSNVRSQSVFIREGLEKIKLRFPFFKEIRQMGLVIGLKFTDTSTAHVMMRALYESGIWAIVAGFDESVIQFKPGALVDRSYCTDVLVRFENACIWLVNNMSDLIMEDFGKVENARSKMLKTLAIEATRLWGLKHHTIELVKHRENAVFKITTKEGKAYAMRIHRSGYHSDAELGSELAWMEALDKDGIGTPAIIPSLTGKLFVRVTEKGLLAEKDTSGSLQCSMLAWIEGVPFNHLGRVEKGVQQELEQRYYHLGVLAGKLHNQGESWQPPTKFTRHSWDAEGLLGDEPLWGQFWKHPLLTAKQSNMILKARLVLQGLLKQIGQNKSSYGLIHADFLPENILVHDEQLRLIDFDDCGYGWYLFEMATSLFPQADQPFFNEITDAYVAGYRSERELSEEQLELLPAFILIRAFTYLGWLKSREGSLKHGDKIALKLSEALMEFIPQLLGQLTVLQRIGVEVIHVANKLKRPFKQREKALV